MDITCLLQMWETLHNEHGVRELRTRQLNQDCVENLFSIIRSKGGARDNPEAQAFRAARKKVCFQENIDAKENPPQKNEKTARGMYRHLLHVLSSRKQAYRQCLCEGCKNIDLKLDTLNRYLKEPVDGGDALSERSLCHELTLLCLDRECPCGADKVELEAAIQPRHSTVVKWKTWEMVEVVSWKEGRAGIKGRHFAQPLN